MTLWWFTGLRYLKAKRREPFISLITIISILGVALGVMTLIVVLSVMSGFDLFLRDKIVGNDSHILVDKEGGITRYKELGVLVERIDHVLASSPVVYGLAMLSSDREVAGVVVKGVDLSQLKKVNPLSSSLREGELTFQAKGSPDGILIGRVLAWRLGVGVGDVVKAVSPVLVKERRRERPLTKDFEVTGIIDYGYYEYDVGLILISLSSSQELFNLGGSVSGIELMLDDLYLAEKVSSDIEERTGLRAQSWMERHKELFSALRLEKTVQFVIVVLIIVVAAFNIISTLMMIVMERTKAIGILKSIGASQGSIMSIFLFEGCSTGMVGTLLGFGGGLALAHSLNRVLNFLSRTFGVELLSPQIYYFDELPVKVQPLDVGIICTASLLICFLAIIYPSWRASRLDPVEALRYE